MNNKNGEDLRIDLSRVPTEQRTHSAPTYQTAPPQDTTGGPVYVSAGGSDQPTESTGRKVGRFVKGSLSLTLKYFAAKLLVGAIITIVCGLVLSFLDVKWAFFWALLAGVGNCIPVFGQWVGMIGCIGGAWAVSGDWKVALYTLLTILVVQVLDEFLLTPLLVGKATSVKPLLIIIIMLLASSFFGFWGVLFAVPIAAIIKLGYDIFWLGRKAKENNQ